MLVTLQELKTRLELADNTKDALLNQIISGVSGQFAYMTNRTLERVEGAVEVFPGTAVDVIVAAYPIESVSKWELKRSESEGWVEKAGVDPMFIRGCRISLGSPLGGSDTVGRVTYTGGYVPAGGSAESGWALIPADLREAVLQACSYVYQTRTHVGATRMGPSTTDYVMFSSSDWPWTIRKVILKYARFPF